jgi:hypothetical protein
MLLTIFASSSDRITLQSKSRSPAGHVDTVPINSNKRSIHARPWGAWIHGLVTCRRLITDGIW